MRLLRSFSPAGYALSAISVDLARKARRAARPGVLLMGRTKALRPSAAGCQPQSESVMVAKRPKTDVPVKHTPGDIPAEAERAYTKPIG